MPEKKCEEKKKKLSHKKRQDGGRREGGGEMSSKLWRGEKFHPVEIHLTQEERRAKTAINTVKKEREKETENNLSMRPDSEYFYKKKGKPWGRGTRDHTSG